MSRSEWWLDTVHGGLDIDRLLNIAGWAVECAGPSAAEIVRFFEKPWSYPEWHEGWAHDEARQAAGLPV